MRIIVIVGARPNFIKVGPLLPALAAAGIDAPVAHTGQHYDATMSDVFFADLEIAGARRGCSASAPARTPCRPAPR